MNLSSNQSLLIFLLYVRQTWMTQLILAIYLWGYHSLSEKDSVANMHGLAVYVKEGLPLAQDLSVESSAESYLCFWLALLHPVSYFFFLNWSPSLSLSNIDEIPSINPSAYVFIFGNFNVHYKDWLTYSGGTDRPGQLSYNFATHPWLWLWQSCSFGFIYFFWC